MSCTSILKARVPESIKVQAQAVAAQELLTESGWLKQLILRELRAANPDGGACRGLSPNRPCRRVRTADGPKGRCRPIYVRLHADDRALLEARAEARGMRPATYLSVLARAHLRRLAPLPKDELMALKRSTGELAAIGRNLNQITKVTHEGKVPGSVRDEFRAMLKICEALRDSTKALIKRNVTSWETGHEEADL